MKPVVPSTDGTASFETWLNDFVVSLGRYIAPAQADKFLHVYRKEAEQHYRRGLTPLQAVEKELL